MSQNLTKQLFSVSATTVSCRICSLMLALCVIVVGWTQATLAQSQQPQPASRAVDGQAALEELKQYLADHTEDFSVADLASQDFAKVGLDRAEADAAKAVLVQHHQQWVKTHRQQEMDDLVLQIGDHSMPFWFKVYGEKPEGGRSLYISMHGGGGAPKRVNDQQWDNQKKLYQPEEGVYVAPRAPVDAWNMWHVGQVDDLFQRLIENMVVFHDVNPDRVYLMGYSAGGDGVYQIAPRWADHLAAAAMMAGHPNETTADGLRNLPFCLQMGGKDGAYDRNKIAGQWKTKLEELQKSDPDGYTHLVKIYPDYGHWMNREDAIAVPWMAKFDRNRFPRKIVWKQDDVIHDRFYWLTNEDSQPKAKSRVEATWDGQQFEIQSVSDVQELGLILDDQADLNLDKPITVNQIVDGKKRQLFNAQVQRTIGTLAESLWERGDPKMVASAKLTFELKSSEGEAKE